MTSSKASSSLNITGYGCQTQEQLFFDSVVARTDSSTGRSSDEAVCKSGVEADESVRDYLASQCFVLYEH